MIKIEIGKDIIKDEISIKHKRLNSLMDRKNLDKIILLKSNNFAWLTGGGEDYVDISTEFGTSYLVVTREEITIKTDNIEVERLRNEEIPVELFNIEVSSWLESKAIPRQGKIGSDFYSEQYIYIENELSEIRSELLPSEIKRYRWLGRETAIITERIASGVEPGMTERDIAGEMAGEFIKKGMLPIVNLVGADDRVYNYRHPVPKNNKIVRYVMIVACSRKWGLVVNLTRIVHFGSLNVELERKYKAVQKIEQQYLENTREGQLNKVIIERAMKEYETAGYPDELKKHHQGGITGYESREEIVTLNSTSKVRVNQAYAWNPSITGVKIEDTFLVTDNGLECITGSGDWPVSKFHIQGKEISRPEILIR